MKSFLSFSFMSLVIPYGTCSFYEGEILIKIVDGTVGFHNYVSGTSDLHNYGGFI